MARKQYEANFIAELKRAIRFYYSTNSFWYKIPDDRKFKKPFDVFFSTGNLFYALEMKVHPYTTVWPLSKIESHQIEGLQKAMWGGYISWVLVNVRVGVGNGRRNFVRMLSLGDITRFQEEGRKSVSVDELEDGICIYKKKDKDIGENLWQVKNLFG